MDPTVRYALQRAVVAFLITFVVGSGLVFAVDRVGGDGAAEASPTGTASPSPDQPDRPPAVTPEAHLLWVAGGFPGGFGEELTTVRGVRRASVATAGVGWLTRSLDADGSVVDEPTAPYMVPLEVTGIDTSTFAAFLPQGPRRQLVLGLEPDQALLSQSEARLRGLRRNATLVFDGGIELTVAGILPDVLMGAYEVMTPRATAERLGADLPRYALLRVRAGAAATAEELRGPLLELLGTYVRQPALEVRLPGETELLRAHDRSLPPITLKRRFGEFAAHPDAQEPNDLDLDPAWVESELESREIVRLGTVRCHRKTLFVLRQAMQQMSTAASLGAIGPCFDDTWSPRMRQGTLPAALWGAAIRLNTALNLPGNPPLMDGRIVEAMTAWGFRWAGNDAFPDGALFEFVRTASEREATPTPSIEPSPVPEASPTPEDPPAASPTET
jgi:hypothetical protein